MRYNLMFNLMIFIVTNFIHLYTNNITLYIFILAYNDDLP